MARSQQSTLQLVETLLDVYRNDAEGLALQREPMDMVALTESVIASLVDLAAVRRIHIRLNHGNSDFRQALVINGDPLQLRRVLTNLVINGINHAPRGSAIDVLLESLGTKVALRVSDGGSGISNLELPHLFERFYQGAADRQAKGTGLGLYLSRQIVEAHGGKIWAENRRPQGATFGIELPKALPAR